MEPKLQPCPFCGGEARVVLESGRTSWAVECRKCGGSHARFGSEESAIAAWNTRTDALEAITAALEVARDFIDGEPALDDHTCPGVNCARCKRRLDAFTAVNATLAALKEPRA